MAEGIEIVDLDVARSRNPDPQKALYDMHLVLSAVPDRSWIGIFDNEHKLHIHNMWRRATVTGKYIVVHCAPDEIEKYHMPHFQQVVKNTNEKYAAYVTAQEQKRIQQQAQKEAAEQAERDRLEGIKSRLFSTKE